jgi:DNA-binding winged helix-turn-helix (wHTH) protein
MSIMSQRVQVVETGNWITRTLREAGHVVDAAPYQPSQRGLTPPALRVVEGTSAPGPDPDDALRLVVYTACPPTDAPPGLVTPSPQALAAEVARALHGAEVATHRVQLSDGYADVTARQVVRSGSQSSLSTNEARCLAFLSAHRDRVVSRDELLREVWEYSADVRSRAVDSLLFRLRKKVEPDPTQPVHLVSVRGGGYRFEPAKPPESEPDSEIAPIPLRQALTMLGHPGSNPIMELAYLAFLVDRRPALLSLIADSLSLMDASAVASQLDEHGISALSPTNTSLDQRLQQVKVHIQASHAPYRQCLDAWSLARWPLPAEDLATLAEISPIAATTHAQTALNADVAFRAGTRVALFQDVTCNLTPPPAALEAWATILHRELQPDPQSWGQRMALLAPHWRHILFTAQWCLAHEKTDLGALIAAASTDLMLRFGHAEELANLLTKVSATRISNTTLEQIDVASLRVQLQLIERSSTLEDPATRLANREGASDWAKGWGWLVAAAVGQPTQAEHALSHAQAYADACQDPGLLIRVAMERAMNLVHKRSYQQVVGVLCASEAYQAECEPTLRIRMLELRGALAHQRQEFATADSLFDQAETIAQELDMVRSDHIRSRRALIAQQRGAYGHAGRLYRKQLEVAGPLHAETHRLLGALEHAQGNLAEAEHQYGLSWQELERKGIDRNRPSIVGLMAMIAIEQGEMERATYHIDQMEPTDLTSHIPRALLAHAQGDIAKRDLAVAQVRECTENGVLPSPAIEILEAWIHGTAVPKCFIASWESAETILHHWLKRRDSACLDLKGE